jgi:ATP-dependent Clp protease ATP-binding subunit ClpA
MRNDFNNLNLRRDVAKFLTDRGVEFSTLRDGSFLIEGEDALQPSGAQPVRTGQLARAVAKKIFGDEGALLLLNMAEFREEHDQHRLFGAPPGYVGYEDGGMLTNFLQKVPQCVIFLDEVERVHPKIGQELDAAFTERLVHDNRGVVVSTLEQNVVLRFSNTVSLDTQLRRMTLQRSMKAMKPLKFRQPGAS